MSAISVAEKKPLTRIRSTIAASSISSIGKRFRWSCAGARQLSQAASHHSQSECIQRSSQYHQRTSEAVLLPPGIDILSHGGIHDHFARPGPRETLTRSFPCCINAHFAAMTDMGTGVVENIQRSVGD